jgi:CHAT domain-containing protein
MDEITAIIKALLQHQTAPSLYQYITAYPEVLSDQVDAHLVNILDNLQEEDMDLAPFVASRIRTLRLCRLIGVDQVFKQEIAEKFILIGYFLDSKTWEESQEFLGSHPELIQEQVELLLDCLAQVQLDREKSAIVQEHRELLKRCREVGIDRAFQEKIKALDLEESSALYPIKIIPQSTEYQRQNYSMFQVYGVRLPGFVNHLAKCLRLKYTLFPWNLLYVEWLKKIYAITSTKKNVLFPEEYIYFFIQSLQVSWNNQGHPLVIREFLENNLDNLNDTLGQFLYSFNKDSLGGLDTKTLANFAVTVLDLFGVIEKYPHGNEEINIEIAIAGYEIVTNPFIREAALEEWVRAQVYLATAYRDRIRGERFENIEKIICACRNGLQACNERSLPKRRIKLESELRNALSKRNYGKESSPQEIIFAYSSIWYAYSDRENNPEFLDNIIEEFLPKTSFISDNASSKLNVLVWPLLKLSSAYSNSVQGNRSENLQRSISCSKDILDIVDSQINPIEWAAAQNTLGYAYTERIKEKHTQNVEKAIRCHLAALDKCTREVSAQEWARGQSDLGIAYKERVLGERAENLEAAIQCYSSALEVYSRELYPFEWAKTQYNLGVACVDRIRGNKAQNLANAIQCFSSALEVFTIEDYAQKWASTMQALGNTYLSFSSVSMIEEAIQCFTSALKVYSSEFSPFEWARTQFNLSNAYLLLSMQKNKAENLETAIRLCLLSLEVRLRKTDSNRWGMTQSRLGLLYSMRVNGETTKNLKVAIQSFLRALEVYSYEAYPLKYAKNQYFLGITYQKADCIENAYTVLKKAIDCIESIREEIIFGTGMEADKQKLAEGWNDLYQNMIKVCLELEKPVEAIEYVERSKTRNLVELILSKDIDTIFTPDVVSKLEEFRDEITSGQYELQHATAEDPTALAQQLQQLRQQRNELQDRYLPLGSGFQFDPFRSTLSDRTAIVEFYITTDKLLVFIITKQTQQPIVFSSDLIDPNKLGKWASSYLKAYINKNSHWQRRLTTHLHLLAKILHIDEIIKQIPTECDKLILIPHRYLHLVPLHALPINSEAGTSQPQIIMDRFPKGVRYAPSCQLLQLAKTRKRPNFTHLFAIQNPTKDLTFADFEVAAIQSYFDSTSILEKDAATKAALDDIPLNTFHCVHFSCHGYFNSNPSQANKSVLILADAELDSSFIEFDSEHHLLFDGKLLDLDKCLTLDAIFSLKFQLDRCRLVVLSACETGLIDFHNTSDEYIGLVSGFLFAGSPSVVSSLWKVDQVSTAFLFIKFYENLKSYPELGEGDVAMALQDAQSWLRNLTSEEGEKLLEKIQPQIESLFPGKPRTARAFKTSALKRIKESGIYPFSEPYYWAAFTATGF